MKSYKHIITTFQQTFVNNGEIVIEILDLLFPDLDIDWNEERGKLQITAHPCYTWVNIKYKDLFHFAINNHATVESIYGPAPSLQYHVGRHAIDYLISELKKIT